LPQLTHRLGAVHLSRVAERRDAVAGLVEAGYHLGSSVLAAENQNRKICAQPPMRQALSVAVPNRSELVSVGEWVRCVMACRIGWMAAGLGLREEPVHDFGAGGDDGS
jgi:hypothetical protein